MTLIGPKTSALVLVEEKPEGLSALVSSPTVGAFAGAFFAFLFGLVSYCLLKRHERFVLHRTSIVRLERLLHEHIHFLDLNRQNALAIKQVLIDGKLTFHRFEELPFIKELSNDLACLDLINGYFFYERDTSTTNFNFRSINYTLTRLEDGVIAGHKIDPGYIKFLLGFIEQILDDVSRREKETRNLLCLARIHLTRLKGKGFIYGALSLSKEIEITQAEKNSELQKLLEEYPI